jgi:uncharacterized protein YecE (DUF72 family)
MAVPSIHVATAGWQIPRAIADRFPASGSVLERYAAVFDAVEVNTSFYRPHRRAIWERWAAATPPHFRFSAKLPRVVTHERRLIDCAEPIDRFLAETAGLGQKLGAVLIQTPGALTFDPDVFAAFARLWRERFVGDTAWEPRHASWFTVEAETALAAAHIARVAADPAPRKVESSDAGRPGGWPGLVYRRLHGSPRMYVTPYSDTEIGDLASETVAQRVLVWIVFDNTMSGAAAENALFLDALIGTER